MVVVFALGAGLCYALASVMQHHVAAQQAPELSLRPRLILELVKRPLWLAGIVLDVGAYLLEAAALSVGSIVVVQPLLVSGLLFALPLSAIGGVGKPGRQEWVAAVALTLGIAVFVTVGSPQRRILAGADLAVGDRVRRSAVRSRSARSSSRAARNRTCAR